MKHLLLTIVVLALVATVAGAQDIETMMAGRAQIGAGILAEAWLENPAVLGLGGADAEIGERGWRHGVSAVYELDGEVDLRSLAWGGYPAGGQYGVGIGLIDVAGMQNTGIGVGYGAADGRLAAGLNYQGLDVGPGDTRDVFDFAIGGRLLDVCAMFDRATWGIVARDISDEIETTYDVGVGLESPRWRVAVDFEDVTDEIDSIVQIGATRRFGSRNQWQVGAGLDEEDLTAGVAFHTRDAGSGADWKVGLAYLEGDRGAEDAWVFGAGVRWGE